MRPIIKKYNEALKVPMEIYEKLHTDFLVPLDIVIDAEDQFKETHEYFYIWGNNKPHLKTRKGMALVNLSGENNKDDVSIGPLDHHNRENKDTCYLESDFRVHTKVFNKNLDPLKQFDLCRSSILWWQKGDNFVPHTDVVLPTVNLRLWGSTSNNVSLRYGENLIEAEYEPNRLYLIDTSIVHDARAYDEVYQYFIALLPTKNNYDLLHTLKKN